MSKVIKYPVWKEAPHTIEAPPPPPMPHDDAPDLPAAIDEEAVARRLSEIAAKERRAKEILEKNPDLMAYLIYDDHGQNKVYYSPSLEDKIN